MPKLSRMTTRLLGQPMFNLLEKANRLEQAGKRILHFEIGDPLFKSPINSIRVTQKALEEGMTHYTSSLGLPEYRMAVANHVERALGFKPSIPQIISCPANAIIDFVIRCVAEPGDEIVIPDPGFPTYFSVINYLKMVPAEVPLLESNNFCMRPEDVFKRITHKTKLIIVNSPNNPTGSVMEQEQLNELARMARDRDIFLLSDEVYSQIIYQKAHYSPCVIDRCTSYTILLNSLSKTYAMSGWRLGYAVGPEKLIEKIGLLLQTIWSCLPPFTQVGGAVALEEDSDLVQTRVELLRSFRDRLVNGLNSIPRLSCVLPEGAFYAFANITSTGLTSDEYASELLENTGVCVLPGNCFGKYGQGFVRLCYASSSREMIDEALDKMYAFHKSKWG